MTEELLGLGDEVEALEAVIKETDDSANEPIDLLDARLTADAKVTRAGRRYARSDRWAALAGALDNWTNTGQLA